MLVRLGSLAGSTSDTEIPEKDTYDLNEENIPSPMCRTVKEVRFFRAHGECHKDSHCAIRAGLS